MQLQIKKQFNYLKLRKNLEEENMNLAKELKELEQKYKQSLEKLKKLKLQQFIYNFYIK